ncbi:MAG: lipopolysaccharide biosynthesis protein, partial [Planctomycetaceae bacterium]
MSARSVRINLLCSWGAHGVALLIGVVLMPFVLGVLGDATYGTWIFINAIAGYSGLMYLGFGEATGRYVARHHERGEWEHLNRVVTGVLAVYLVMGAAVVLLAGLLAWLAPHLHDWDGRSITEIRGVILILGVTVAIGMIGSVFGGVLIGIQRFDLERGLTMLAGLVRLALTLAFLSSTRPLLTLAVIYLIITIIENGGHMLAAFTQARQLSPRPRHFCLKTLRECTGFSLFALVDDAARQLIHATDSIVIGVVLGAQAIVPYFIAHRLCQFLGAPVLHVARVFMPRAGQLHAAAEAEPLRRLAARGVGLAFLLMAGCLIGAAFFGDELIRVWVGGGYGESHRVLIVLLTAATAAVPMMVLRGALFAMGRVRVPALIYLLEAVTNLVLTLVLIGPLGLLGVALGTAVPLLVCELGLLLPYAARSLQMSCSRLLIAAVLPQLSALPALLAYSAVVSAWLPAPESWFALAAVA